MEEKYLDRSYRLKTAITAYEDKNDNSYEMPAKYTKC